MMNNLSLARIGLFVFFFLFTFSVAQAEPSPSQAIPSNAVEVPVSQASQLQTLLKQYRVVRLQPGDYSAAGTITMDNCQQIYGLPGTKISKIVVPGGTVGAIVSGVETQLEFPASNLLSHDNQFRRIRGPITAIGATMQNNLFLDISWTKIYIDNSQGGYWKNNRFIRVMTQSSAPPIVFKGDPQRQSTGNVFLWTNILTPHGDGVYLDNQADMSMVGLDTESWNWDGTSSNAIIKTGPMGILRVFTANGGSYVPDAYKTGIFDVSADAFQLQGLSYGSTGEPSIVYRGSNSMSSLINVQRRNTADYGNNPLRFKGFEDGFSGATLNGNAVSSLLGGAQQNALKQMYDASRPGLPWERPTHDVIPDPAGPNWNQDLASKPDSTAYIQNLVNTQGIARLPAGIYYISQPIKLKNGQGIVGAGADRTAIIAKNPGIDMIIGDDHLSQAYSGTTMVLMDVTLQGGKNGIHHEPNGSGPGAQYTDNVISHVTFRDMSESGIFVDRIFGWDNNLIDYVNFYNMPAGIKQRVDPNWNPSQGDAPGMSYMDKNVFYKNQYVSCGRGVDMEAVRQDTLNAWINSVFADNKEYAVFMKNGVSTLFANTDFIDNGGDPVVNNDQQTSFVSCRFVGGALGNGAMLPWGSNVEGSTFEMGGSTRSTIVQNSARAFLTNCRSLDMPIGVFHSGMLMNSVFGANPNLSQQVVMVNNTQPFTLVPGAPNPVPQLLFGDTL